MKAFRLTGYAGPNALVLDDVEEPAGDGGTATVEVRAIGVNFPDLLMTQGLYQLKPEPPFIPGCEVAGVVRSAPEGSGWRTGDRVAAFIWQGGYAEIAPVPVARLVAIPASMGFDAAASLLVNHHTVYFGLARRGRLTAGETLLVLGAAGGIGSAAVQVGKGLGARVLAGVADQTQSGTAMAAGADDVVLLEEGFAKEVRARTGGRGVDAVLDPLGDWLFVEATRALAPEGRILVVGFAAGKIPQVKANRLLLNNISAVGVAWGASLDHDGTVLTAGAEALNHMFEAGTVRPQIGRRFGFDEIPLALDELRTGRVPGKGIIEVPRVV
ncbi:NADPH:quinone oxidoreductase family protein [Spirillospora sp. CA-255316]